MLNQRGSFIITKMEVFASSNSHITKNAGDVYGAPDLGVNLILALLPAEININISTVAVKSILSATFIKLMALMIPLLLSLLDNQQP